MKNLQNQNKILYLSDIAAVDLFCGVGGLTHGLQKGGINVTAGYDFDESCRYAFEANNDGAKFLAADVSTLSSADIERHWGDAKIRVLVGCAPCQPFSKHTQKLGDKRKDSRWRLLESFARQIEELQPDIVSMENVVELSKEAVFDQFLQTLRDNGYHVDPRMTVFGPDYGLPQSRKRLVLLASKLGPISLIPPTHTPSQYHTVRKAIGDLAPLEAGEKDEKDPLHRAQKLIDINLKRMRQSTPGRTWRDWDEDLVLECHKKKNGKTYGGVYGRMQWDKPSPTMTTQFYLYGTGRFGHPEQDRAMTLREGAILQTFPQDYQFVGSEKDITFVKIGRHIGNAVPPKLGEVIGQSIIKHLKEVRV